MHIIDEGAPIESLWNLLLTPGDDVEPNRIVGVQSNSSLVGIITDSDLRRFISTNQKIPQHLSQITNKNFICVKFSSDRLSMAMELNSQLEARDWSVNSPIQDVIVEYGNGVFGFEPLTQFLDELENIRDEYVIFGMGYVGLTLLAVIAQKGLKAVGVESNAERLMSLQSEKFYIKEPKLEEFLEGRSNVSYVGSLNNIESSESSRKHRRVFLIAVNTPVDKQGLVLTNDLSQVVEDIGRNLVRGDLVILRSTVRVGTTEDVVRQLESISGMICGTDFYVGFAPERTVEGNAIRELQSLPQIVGGFSQACLMRIRKVVENWAPNVQTAQSTRVAEMVKLANNSFRDYHFAFANEMTRICMNYEIDVYEVIRLANNGYPRSNIPTPSPGVGGPCLTKDSYILYADSQMRDNTLLFRAESPILSARKLNQEMSQIAAEKFHNDTSNLFPNLNRIHLLGLAFKGIPETNDMRNSPAIEMLRHFEFMGYSVTGWDSVSSMPEIINHGISSLEDNESDFLAIVIGNNNPKNMVQLFEIIATGKVRIVFDPWDLIRESSQLFTVLKHKIPVSTLTTLEKV